MEREGGERESGGGGVEEGRESGGVEEGRESGGGGRRGEREPACVDIPLQCIYSSQLV